MSKSVRKWLLLMVATMAVCFVVSKFFYQLALIQGQSMEPAYSDHQLVIIDKFSDKNNDLAQNDVVVIKARTLDTIIIKRIVAGPGDAVRIADGICYVNDEVYATGVENVDLGEDVVILTDEYFVLGDNYADSIDSRSNEVGLISPENIIGKVVFPVY